MFVKDSMHKQILGKLWKTINVRDDRKLQTLTLTFQSSQNCLNDRRIECGKVAEVMTMSKERVCYILNQDLDMGKLSVHWVRGCSLQTKNVFE